MKCPHCSTQIGLFSKELNEIGKTGTCPSCGQKVKLGILHARFAAGLVPVAILAMSLGVSGPVAAGIAGAVGAAIGLGLKSAET